MDGQVIKLTDGQCQGDADQVHARLSVASVRRSLANLDLATATAKAGCLELSPEGSTTCLSREDLVLNQASRMKNSAEVESSGHLLEEKRRSSIF